MISRRALAALTRVVDATQDLLLGQPSASPAPTRRRPGPKPPTTATAA